MTVKVVTQPDSNDGLTFTFVVPAGEIWALRAVNALATRGAGGTPGRAYRLDITDGTNVVSAFGAIDAGTDPGTCEITWADTPGAQIASGNIGVSTAPMRVRSCPTGYQIVGTIINNVGGDNWDHATVWVDYALSP